MATLIRTDGSLQIVSDIHKLAHDDLRSLIGGPTEYILFWNGRALIVNEMSEHKQLSVNKGATSLLQQHKEMSVADIGASWGASALPWSGGLQS